MTEDTTPGEDSPDEESRAGDPASQWENVAEVSQIDDGRAIEVVVRGNVIAIFNDGGNFYALDGLCAHQGGPVANGELSKTDQGDTCVTCPWPWMAIRAKNGHSDCQPSAVTTDFSTARGR